MKKRNNYIYPRHHSECTLENWDACIECRYWDNCERKELFRKGNVVGLALILLTAILINLVIAYLIGVL